MKIKITTDRRPFTPDGRAEKGAVLDLSPKDAQVLIDNGFAEKVEPKKKAAK
jgi:hypothetical protein